MCGASFQRDSFFTDANKDGADDEFRREYERTTRTNGQDNTRRENETRNNREITVHVGQARQDDAASVLEGLRVPPRPSNPNAAARGIRERGVVSRQPRGIFVPRPLAMGGRQGRAAAREGERGGQPSEERKAVT